MRLERERRTDKNWSFCSYFLLQVAVGGMMWSLVACVVVGGMCGRWWDGVVVDGMV